jgi:UDP-N-acetylglucosamine--N-acetylmuramyl-(pentapeptide) pyrophosphoryl-undecaprenol N-acetylglucosamine transferase
LAGEIAARFRDPQGLTRAAAAAKSAGVTDAAERLAAQVLRLAAA